MGRRQSQFVSTHLFIFFFLNMLFFYFRQLDSNKMSLFGDYVHVFGAHKTTFGQTLQRKTSTTFTLN